MVVICFYEDNRFIYGKILKINSTLPDNLDYFDISPYGKSWICVLDADNIDSEVKDLKIGKAAVSFFQDEIEHCRTHFKSIVEDRKRDKNLAGLNGFCFGKIKALSDKDWDKTINKFFSK